MSDHPFQAPSPEYLAALLPQYDVEFFIAQGGMGAVYKGRQLSLDRDIAIKVLPHEMGESEEFRESFISEARAMAKLNHSNLLGVFDYGTVEGMPYIVMQYVDGGSLHDAAYNQAVEPMQSVAIVRGICEGLSHAHENGIVHRDIKPSNILLNQKAEPLIADFGLAHAADSDQPGLVMGTPGYTAPEVFHDPDQAGPLADIYSVGVILHQLLTGIDPAGSMEPPSQTSGSIRLDAICRKATHMDPAQRYSTVAAMIADLDKWISAKQKLSVSAPPTSFRPASRPAPLSSSGGGGGATSTLVILGVLVVLLVIGYQVLRDDKQAPPQNVITDSTEAPGTSAPAPDPDPITPPKPVSLPTEDDKPSFTPEPLDTDVDDKPEPVTVAEVDDKPEPEPSENQKPGDPELRERAIGLIGEARKKRDKELSDNVSALHFALRPLSSGASAEVLTLLEKVKSDIVDGRIPLIDSVIGLPENIAAAFKVSLTKEKVIDEKYRADLTRIRDAYVTRLQGASDQASDEDLKKRLVSQAKEAEDLVKWIASLSPEPERVVRKSTGVISGGFAGNWDIHTNGKVERWTAHADGKVEVIGQKWVGTWEILDNGTLQVYWEGKKPYILTRDTEGWTGKTSFDHAVSFKPGDW